MRQKKVKAIRRMARAVSGDLPERREVVHRETGQVKNDTQSVRGLVRRWKKLTTKGRTVFTDGK